MKWWISLFALFFFVTPVNAVTITISEAPASIGTESFTLSAFVDGPSPGTNYLRVDLYKETTINYFGETFNGSDWHSDSNGTNYFPITIDSSGTASAQLTARLGTPSVTDYPGPGQYKVKIRRYTSSGNPASSDQQTPIDISITYAWPTPTPTPSATPIPTNTAAPTNTPVPTATSTPTPVIIIIKTPTSTKKTTPTPTSQPSAIGETTGSADVLSAVDLAPETESTPTGNGSMKVLIVSLLLIGLGLALLSILFIWKKRKAMMPKEEHEL